MTAIDAVDGSSPRRVIARESVADEVTMIREEAGMQAVTTIGLDIAKSVLQVHGIDAAGKVVGRQQQRRSRVLRFFRKLSPCLVGIEACTSSHHWSRDLQALGHTVRPLLAALAHNAAAKLPTAASDTAQPEPPTRSALRHSISSGGQC